MDKKLILPTSSHYSRRRIKRQRLMVTVAAALLYLVCIAGASLGFYLVATELHSSLQIVL